MVLIKRVMLAAAMSFLSEGAIAAETPSAPAPSGQPDLSKPCDEALALRTDAASADVQP
jgi:hypothetical protein